MRLILSGLARGVVPVFCVLIAVSVARADDPLPSWNEGVTKEAIVDFVTAVTEEGGPDYVPPVERIATFDNDGTLWVEQPMYTQLQFAFDRVNAMAADHPEWEDSPALKAVIDDDVEAVAKTGKKGLEEILMVTHAGITTDVFAAIVREWIATAKHPTLKRTYTELTYQPMKELIVYLQDNGFKTYIVSGGGVEFMRPWTEEVYGIPPEQVIGSSILTRFEIQDGEPVLMREPKLFFFDDEGGKPVGINMFIGRRPIAAFGNSDHDIPMLQWTLAGDGPRLAMLVHHTDGEREFAYDRDSSVGKLAKGIDGAKAGGWRLIDMKNDWNRVFAFEE